MLDVLNRYVHGYVAMPVILTCFRKGLFNLLISAGPLSLEQISQQLEMNTGHLQISLHMFESMGWIKKNDRGCYETSIASDSYQSLNGIPEKILSLYKIPTQELLEKYTYKKSLQKWLHFVMNYTNNKMSYVTEFLQGVVIVPLLIALKQANIHADSVGFSALPKKLRHDVISFFVFKNWAVKIGEDIVLTDAGKFMQERAYNMATAASYAPMLDNIATLLFGDPKKVFKKNARGDELHVDRTLNVIASGFQHVRYFEDVKEVIISIFNKTPFETQPRYIIDTGCGDGTLLKKIYEIICEKSARGKTLEQYPLFMIGIDYNKKSLEATEKTLQNIPHFTLHGDIGNPLKIKEDLKNLGIPDPENCLHIRSFLDHDRPYISPIERNKIQERLTLNYQGVYVDNNGAAINAVEMVQSLVEHLSRWSSIIARHGLLILEVHCLSSETVSSYIDENESFHFDAYHAFSKQYLVEADVFLLSAAEVGLFPKMEFSRRYPSAFPYSRITLNFFEKREYIIQHAKKTDIPELLKLEEDCWPKKLRASVYEINHRLEQFPQGQLVVKIANRIVGVVYTQAIINSDELQTVSFENVSKLHNAKGKIIQLLGINVATDIQQTGLGNQLREFVLWWATLKSGIEKVVGVTRCKNYVENSQLSMQQYIKKHDETQGGIDPILRFHTSYGAQIKSILPDYRLDDEDNRGAGILIEYDLFNLTNTSSVKDEQIVHPIKTKILPNNNIVDAVNKFVKKLIPETYRSQYSLTHPLREMGLDSLALLELRTLINQQFGIKLDPTFFFAYNTPNAIIEYLSQQVISDVPVKSEATAAVKTEIIDDANEPIAIVGIGCRFPKDVNNSADFWQLVKEGHSSITATPEQRKKSLGDSISYGGFLKDIDCFDADFFHISPREAELMDPQQRILLEVTWDALEQAGICADQLNNTKTGVFIGVFSHDYEILLTKNKKHRDLDAYYATGNSMSVAAGRLSYILGLQGPSIAINTACSSSLVAVHLACQSLRNGECELAMAGGVNLILSPELNIAFSNAGMLSPEGKCKTFDANADGYVRSEGCGVIVLKKLSQAVADDDTILALIRGSAVNQDGKSNGLTAPSYISQAQLLRDALKSANVAENSISYLEAHGTGTSLGDPIEIKAITEVYGSVNGKNYPLMIGSVKTNMGHAEAAAGIAGLIKTTLMLQNKQIPANLHFNQLNPHIQIEAQSFKFPMHLMPWTTDSEFPRRAGVSSFGFSGTNAHVILEEAPASNQRSQITSKLNYLFVLSAKTETALRQRILELNYWIENHSLPEQLATISYTLNVGRCHFAHRFAVVAGTLEELCAALKSYEINTTTPVNSSSQECVDKLLNEISHIQHLSVGENREKLNLLAKYYLEGCNIDWEKLHHGELKKRLSLPVYPFAKERYWYNSYQKTMPLKIEKSNNVTLEVTSDGIAIVRMIDRDGKNQLSFQFLQAIENQFLELKNNPDVKVVVLTGYDDVFCLGGSEEVLLAISRSEVKYTELSFLYRGLLDCPVPVIAAIQGHAFGAGLAFGLYADMVVMAENSLYAANFMKYGFTPGVGSTLIFQEKLSSALATEMMWTAKEYTGLELKLRGASVSFKNSAEVFSEAMMIAKTLAKKSIQSLKVFKQNMSELMLEKLAKTIERELQMHSDIFANSDSTENIIKYFSKVNNNERINLQPKIEPHEIIDTPQISHVDSTKELLQIVSAKLHIPEEKIDTQRSFKELGVDSISAVEIVREVNKLFHLTIEAAMIYDHPTIQQFAQYIGKEIKPSYDNKQLKINKSIALEKTPHYSSEKIILTETKQSPLQLATSAGRIRLSVKEEQHQVDFVPSRTQETDSSLTDIAIIGFAGHFPGAEDIDSFWDNLSSGISSITEIPKDRWRIENFYDANPEKTNRSNSKWGGFLSDIDQFDPLFFGISPAEAEEMDPQQRLFLQESWKAFEQAGYTPESLSGVKCAVFVGASVGDYANKIKQAGIDPSAHLLIGMNSSILAARISYLLDLKGPSVAIDTACSSSLVAIHQACQSLWTHESDMALAGGVCVLTTSEMHIMTSKAGMLSPEGQCKTFDNSADGFVPGEGVGVVLLKPLSKAIQDKDTICGVIKGSGINQDGKTNGITAPCVKAQTALELEVYKRFHLDPRTISYVEAHGTGTKLGDPIEVSALTRAFRSYTDSNQFCAIGSVKTNIGHSLLAAGIASLIKVLLCLKYKKLIPTLNYKNQNEHINFHNSPFYVNTELKNWESSLGVPRRAAISSFGLSGTNAHMVIEEAPEVYADQPIEKPYYLITLSGKTEKALKQRIVDLANWLTKNRPSLGNISYTLNAKRAHFAWRCACVVKSFDELLETLLHNSLKLEKISFSPESLYQEKLSKIQNEIGESPSFDILSSLGDLYVKGCNIDWNKLYSNKAEKIISLPTYPFSRDKYWISNDNQLIKIVTSEILRIASILLKIKVEDLDVQQKISEYGLDSIGMTSFISAVNKRYNLTLSPAMMYEHATFESFIKYLINNHRHSLETDLPPPPSSPQPTRKTVKQNSDDIAIIGMSGIFPGATNTEQYWENLASGKNAVQEIPKERWDWEQYYGDPFAEPGKTKAKQGGFINDIAQFDAAFFNISPREAELIDPQQRLFLQVVWQAIEDSGHSTAEFSNIKTGVFVGVVSSDYAELLQKNGITDASTITGNTRTMIANRISYILNLQGPSEAIDTACSSSLVAVHHAVQAIRNGDCDAAIAGGVNAILTPTSYLAASRANMLSEDGKCKTFDKNANGYVRAEGLGAIVLKSLAKAREDGDYIYGIIKGSAINHGGHVSSLTVPNPNAQADAIVSACRHANIAIDNLNYIETHGTGTALGDPIEINGLRKAFNLLADEQNTKLKNHYCGLGSVKTNIGHLESAAGIASMIKVLLAMQHQALPANLHFVELNPYIEINDTPFYLVNKAQSWHALNDDQGNKIPRLAGVSAFGFGGVNAHIILEEEIKLHVASSQTKPFYLVTLSAKHDESLKQKIVDLRDWVKKNIATADLESISFTLNVGRDHFKSRCAIVTSSLNELLELLNALAEGQQQSNCILSSSAEANDKSEVYRQNLLALADLYINNHPVDFDALHVSEKRKRIASLPSYPFIKQRYWFNTKTPTSIVKIEDNTLSLHELTVHYLQDVFAETLKLPVNQIAVNATYEVFGVESLLGMEIIKRLEENFSTLPKTLLFEKNTITDLAEYLQKKYQPTLQKLFSKSEVASLNQVVTREISSQSLQPHLESIAIVGLSGTYPMAKNISEFWSNLEKGYDCISEVPPDRWNYKDYPVNIGGEDKYFNQGGFIADIDKFDPLFFNISPREASLLDPQERLFMQSAWETLEDAGYTRESLQRNVNNNVGVFVGVTYNFYPLFIAEEWHKGNRIPLDIQLFSIANRVSYFLNLKGPSLIIDTACSSSLAAIHLAYESIVRGECSMAIAGGVNLSLHPSKFHMLGSYSFMSEVGRCTSFGANGTGYVPGEGVGSVLLKPLSMALRDNDHIYGVIKSSSMNHGGKTSGYTVPNPNAQAELIKNSIAKANVDPRTITYIEAHGTGTALGDPIEIRGLQEAFEDYTQDKQFCAVGSVKSNIGHLESAAGISQLTKVLLQMQHKKIVPSLHSKELNPYIDFDQTPFFVPQTLSDWKSTDGHPLRAGISSFGAGGTNIHLIIEEHIADRTQISKPNTNPCIFILSALNSDQLHKYAETMLAYLRAKENKNILLNDICYTSQIGRESMPSRLAALVMTHDDLVNKLTSYVEQPQQLLDQLWLNNSVQVHNNRENLNEWMQQAQYGKLAQAWVNGAAVSWDLLYINQTPQRISLPTYPFAKRRCWIASQSTPVIKVEPLNETPAEFDEWLYVTRWEKKLIVEQLNKLNETNHWLIFSDNELGLHLQNELGKENCTYCFAGKKFEKVNNNVFYVNPECLIDFNELFADIAAQHHQQFAGIVYLSSFLEETQNTSDQDLWKVGLQSESSLKIFNLLKSLSQQKWQQELKFCLVTRSSQSVAAENKINIWQHHLWSMVRIFAAENPEYKALLLDLELKKHLTTDAKLISHEIQCLLPGENHISYRNNERYVLRLSKYSHRSAIDKQTPWHVPEAAIITGGLGALGIEIAKFLVQQGTKYLLLVGTSVLPDRSATITDPSLKEKITYLIELEKSGATIKYVSADVRDKSKMQAIVEQSENEWKKPITGVFHLAGITTDNVPINKMSQKLLQEVLSIKIQGALALHDIFNKPEVTCFVLFSSISALPYFGIGGLSAYAMANEFLNGLVLFRRSRALSGISIDWAAWADKGMSFKYNHTQYLEMVGMTSVAISEGLKILKSLLTENPAVVAVFKLNWQKFLRINPDAKWLTFFDNYVDQQPKNSDRFVTASLDHDQVTTVLIAQLAELLALDSTEIDVTIPLQNYGMDSIIGVKFVEKLGEHFPDALSPMDLYRYPTISKLVNYLVQTYQQKKAITFPLSLSESTSSEKIISDSLNDIAIIGIGCRFPEANNKNEYWQLLKEGKNVISPIPEQRWELLKNSEEALLQDEAQHCRGGFLGDVTGFDAYFFGITPREAVRMDPQQRLLLEVAYEAFEDAGISTESLAGSSTGVFTSLYANQLSYVQKIDTDMDALYIPTGNAVSIAANRLSYLFDLRGPSVALDTACSSSLVALHLASLNLQNKLCDTALVCAANLNLFPSINVLLSKAKMLSPDGQCKTFDANADGYVQGEGVGVVVLKPLSKALQDNDRIYAVIAGSAVNQDGKTNGLTAPNGLQQETLLTAAYETANIDPKNVSYIECHGTGTFLGDPIELQALGEIVGKDRSDTKPCWIGSVKTNIGHLEPAAGIASVIKVILSLNYGKIPPHLNFSTPNPHIAFDKYHLRVPKKLEEWPVYGSSRIAGISSFGFGGTNAHIVVRELSKNEKSQTITSHENEEEIFILSAKDSIALKILIDRWCFYLENNSTINLSQICYNLHLKRSHYLLRIAIITNNRHDLYRILSQLKTTSIENWQSSDKILINIKKEKINFSIVSENSSLVSLAKSYVNRLPVDWIKYEESRNYLYLDMPLYPWQHKNYWPELKNTLNRNDVNYYPFSRKRIASPLSIKQFEFCFDTKTMPEIADSFNFLHAGYYLEMLAILTNQLFKQNTFTVEDCSFLAPIFIPNNAVVKVQLILKEINNTNFSFIFYSHAEGDHWTQHATGNIRLDILEHNKANKVNKIKNRCPATGTAETFFDKVTSMSMPSGDSIRWTKNYCFNDDEILCELSTPKSAEKSQSFQLNIHLGIIDGCIQSLFMLLPSQFTTPYIASHIKKLTYFGAKNTAAYLHSSLKNIQPAGEKYTGDFHLIDSNGETIVFCEDLTMTQLSTNSQIGVIDNKKLDLSLLSTQECTQQLTNYFIEQTAKIFSMPKNEIDINQSLRDMGIDSLMAIVFASAIESNLGVAYPMQAILKGPTIVEMINFIVTRISGQSVEITSNPWIAYRNKPKNVKSRLFCFPYGGSGASIYHEWQKHVPDSIEVCPIQLPGREDRMNEVPIDNMEPLIDALIENLRFELDLPFSFFGHSFGSLIAFELTRNLRKRGLPQPSHLFVSAFPDPRIPTKSLNNIITQLQEINVSLFDLTNPQAVSQLNNEILEKLFTIFNENGLTEYNANIMTTEITKILLPIFSSDMSIVKNYQYYHESLLDLPITVFTGKRDTWVTYEDHLGWAEHTRKKCQIYSFDHGHLFIRDKRIKRKVIQKITDVMVQSVELI